MKKYRFLLYILAAGLLLASCGQNTADTSGGKQPDMVTDGEQPDMVTDGEQSNTGADGEQPDTDTAESSSTVGQGKVIGICMPNLDETYVNQIRVMKNYLKSMGYTVISGYAEDDVVQQIHQLQNLIDENADCIVIDPVDAADLTEIEEKIAEADIPLIAYDRLLMNTDAVSCYVTYDYKGAGAQLARKVMAEAGIESSGEESTEPGDAETPVVDSVNAGNPDADSVNAENPDADSVNADSPSDANVKTIEFFMGSPDDVNALAFYEGFMEVLAPYLKDGTLVCRSRRTGFTECYVQNESPEACREQCEEILDTWYPDKAPDLIVTAADTLTTACADACAKASYKDASSPVFCELGICEADDSAELLPPETARVTVLLEPSQLAGQCGTLIHALCSDEEPKLSEGVVYPNGKIDVPALLCMPVEE